MIKYCPCQVVTGIPFVTRVELSRGSSCPVSSCHNNQVVLSHNGSCSHNVHIMFMFMIMFIFNRKSISDDILTSSVLDISRHSKDCKCKIWTCFTHAYRPFSVRHWLCNVYVWKLITNNSIENQSVMIFLRHRCLDIHVSRRSKDCKCKIWNHSALGNYVIFVRQVSSRRR